MLTLTVRLYSLKRVLSCPVFLFVVLPTTLIPHVLLLSTALQLTPAEPYLTLRKDVPAFAPPYMQIGILVNVRIDTHFAGVLTHKQHVVE